MNTDHLANVLEYLNATCEQGVGIAAWAEAVEKAIADRETLATIHDLMSGTEWNSDTTSAIAEALIASGRTIEPPR